MRASTVRLPAMVGATLATALIGCNDAGLAPNQLITANIDQARVNPPNVSLSSTGRYTDWSEPVNLGSMINSAATDQQPALSKDGLSLYFASNRLTDNSDTEADQNIWVAQRACADCSWNTRAVLVSAVSSRFLDASPTLSRDGHQLFFASQRPLDPSSETPHDRDLWVSYRENVHDDFGWQAPVNLAGGINSTAEDVAPSYFENEDGLPQLFFNRGVVTGDIYMSQMLADGTWNTATLVDVNSSSPDDADQRPSISHDGLELYFWSNREEEAGAGRIARIWLATRVSVSAPWSVPKLVPSPIRDAQTTHPFIHSHGQTETLLFVRTVPGTPNHSDLFMSQRTLDKSSKEP
jgi:WD40 repeat protein